MIYCMQIVKAIFLPGLTLLAVLPLYGQGVSEESERLRLGIVGLVHDHVHGRQEGLPGSLAHAQVQVVGIAEADAALAARYADRYGVDPQLLYTDLGQMLDEARPEAVMVFTNIFDHRRVVEACARRGIHVMVEKPLAVNLEHARAIAQAARDGGIHVLVNYETTWYPSNHQVYAAAREQNAIGAIRKIVVHSGHEGPKEIGITETFLSWLTDPELNGGGALTDFGCYGANLMTWLMDGQRPVAVSAVTQQLKSDEVYARVDDEATILVVYPTAQGIIQASWNWPFNRKDMEVYGDAGYVHADTPRDLRVRIGEEAERQEVAEAVPAPYDGPLSYLRAVVRGTVEPAGLSSLQNNLIVMEILDAARRSAATGETVRLEQP